MTKPDDTFTHQYCWGCGARLVQIKVRRSYFSSETGKRQYNTYWSCPKSVTAVGSWERLKYKLLHPLDIFVSHTDPKNWEPWAY